MDTIRAKAAEKAEAAERLRNAAPEMHAAIGELRSLITNRAFGIQFAGNEGAMVRLQSCFRDLEILSNRCGVIRE